MPDKVYTSFEEFYAFYLTQHSVPLNKLFHFVGTSLGLACLYKFFGKCCKTVKKKGGLDKLKQKHYKLIPLGLLIGYGFAWFGHFFIEKNKPTTFSYPLYSLRADFRMWWEILTMKHRLI